MLGCLAFSWAGLWLSSRMEILHHVWITCSSDYLNCEKKKKSYFSFSYCFLISFIAIWNHWLWSFCCASCGRASLISTIPLCWVTEDSSKIPFMLPLLNAEQTIQSLLIFQPNTGWSGNCYSLGQQSTSFPLALCSDLQIKELREESHKTWLSLLLVLFIWQLYM